MKSAYSFLLVTFLLLQTYSASAQELMTDTDILAKRGQGVVTQVDFTARANKIPKAARQAALRDTGRLQNVLNTLLLRAQLAADAREAGYDKNPLVQDRMRLAADAELGEAWLQHYVDMQPAADYEQLAREYYELNKQDILSSEKIDVSHILVSTKERTTEEASEIANRLSQEIQGDPSRFDELVMSFSDDPSKSANQGRFYGIAKGEMVESFDKKAFSMQAGEISEPVETTYGFHIIRLDKYHAPEMMSFDAVKDRLMESERARHNERIKQQYLNDLTSLDVQMTKEALEEMVRRQLEDVDAGTEDESTE